MDGVTRSPPPVYYYGSGFAPIMPRSLTTPYARGLPSPAIYRSYKSAREAIIAAARMIYGGVPTYGKASIAKRWALDAGVQEITAKKWLSGSLPEARIQRLAASLQSDLQSTRARIGEIELALQAIAQGRLK